MLHREAVFYHVLLSSGYWTVVSGWSVWSPTSKRSRFGMGADRRASLKADAPLGKGIHDMGKLQGFLLKISI